MQDLERVHDPLSVLRMFLDARLSTLWTAMPGAVEAFNADKCTCSVQLGIKGKLRALDSNGARTGPYEDVTIPLLVDCPVQFQQGGGLALTFPLQKGDEVLVVFASRCIDAWWESGMGPDGNGQPQAELRMHDLSDGFVIPGVRSLARKLANVSTSKAQLRTEDGSVLLELGPSGVHIQGDLTVTGKVTATAEVTAMNAVPATSVKLSTHLHTSAASGSPTSAPTPGS